MEIKLKEKVNVNSFTFKKAVMEQVIGLMGEKDNFLENDIKFYTLLSFVDMMSEDNVILNVLGDTDDLINRLMEDVEPACLEIITPYEEVYEEICDDLIGYFIDEIDNKRTVASLIREGIELISELTNEDITNFFNETIKILQNSKVKIPVAKSNDEKVAEQVKTDIDNLKIKQLIEQYSKVENAE